MWGWGCAGASVTITISGSGDKTVTTEVGHNGLWSAEVGLTPGGPYSLTLTHQTAGDSGTQSVVTLADVLAGDVWVS